MGGQIGWKRRDTVRVVGLGYVVFRCVLVEPNMAGCHSMHILYYLEHLELWSTERST
jgi:hypothetical protein